MVHYKYIIVGGGMTGAAAAKGIRAVDEQGSIGMFTAEPDPPYNRPPLSKGLWKGKPVEKIWREVPQGVEVFTSLEVKTVNPITKTTTTSDSMSHTFDKLLLATGGSPRKLVFGGDAITYFRTFRDYQWLREMADHKQRFAVIGSGFIATEIAAALKIIGKDVVLISHDKGLGTNIYPPDLARYLVDYYRQKGVDVRTDETIVGVEQQGEEVILKGKGGKTITADAVVAGIGIQPNLMLAKVAGLKLGDGIIVDEYLRTNASDIYAAGDVADFYNPALDQRMRVEHEDNANTMGERAGRNMAGEMVRYDHLPMFYSDLFDHGYEAVGQLNAKMAILPDWQEQYQKGVLYYMKDNKVRGVLLWNVWDQVEHARTLIQQGDSYQPHELKGKLPV